MSVAHKVLSRLNRLKRGAPFCINSFYDLGSKASVQKAFSRLVRRELVARVSRGFYARPKPLPSMQGAYIAASATDVARAWAKQYRYTLVSQGLESAYRLGLQRQAPVKSVYWSDGPSRAFKIGFQVVEVKHRSPNQLLWAGQPTGELLRGLTVTPSDSVDMSTLAIAFRRLGLSSVEIKSVIQNLRDSSLPKKWKLKLEAFEQTLVQ